MHDLATGDFEVLPPVRRGDVDRLATPADETRVVIVCDGVFQSEPAVSHAELCRALDRGWQLWGVSSLGAIRAHELRSEGMKGFGYVHAQFAKFEDFTDDEMCLLHFPQEPYFPVSEALVNVRYALERNRARLRIGLASERKLLDSLREMWFGDRTESTIRRKILEHTNLSERRADALVAWLGRNKVKTLDLERFLTERPWLDA